MGEHCDPKYFYHTYRFFLNGWGTNDILPDGIDFEARFIRSVFFDRTRFDKSIKDPFQIGNKKIL